MLVDIGSDVWVGAERVSGPAVPRTEAGHDRRESRSRQGFALRDDTLGFALRDDSYFRSISSATTGR
jgi:hypothetical protein